MYIAIGAGVCLAVFFLAAAVAYVLLLLTAPLLRRWARRRPARVRAAILFVAAVAPSFGALLLTAAVALPAFLLFEPPWSGERVGPALPLLGAAGAGLLAIAAWRLCRLQWATWQVERRWRGACRPVTTSAGIPLNEVRVDGALLGTVGLLRPQVYASRDVMTSLDANELRAALAHEAGHVSAADNLKRLLLAASPGMSLLDPVLGLGADWARACEVAADEAALESGVSAMDLASALVKAGRLRFNHDAARLTATSHLVAPAARSDVEERVRNLAERIDAPASSQRSPAAAWIYAGLASAAVVAYALYFFPLMLSAHEVLEHLVR